MEEKLNIVRNKLINNIVVTVAFFSTPIFIFSIYRLTEQRWNHIFYLHIFIAVSFLLVALFRKKLSVSIKGHSQAILSLLISISGLVFFSLSSSYYYCLMSVFVSALLFGKRTALVYMVISIICIVIALLLIKYDTISYSVDFNKYNRSLTNFILNVLYILMLMLVLIHSIGLFTTLFTQNIKSLINQSIEQQIYHNELINSEARYKNLMDNIAYPIVVSNFDGSVLYFNNKASDYFKVPLHQISFINAKDFWDSASARAIFLEEMNRNGQVNNFQASMKDATNEQMFCLLTSSIIDYYGMQAILTVLNDITRQRTLEKKILTNTIETEEAERKRFAQELHDKIGTLLSTVKMYLQWLMESKTQANSSDVLQKVHDIVVEIHESVRQISFKLSPYLLQHFGVIEAIKAYATKIMETSQLIIFINSDNFFFREIQTETIIYRIITECISNTLKYTNASEARIEFCEETDYLRIEYSVNNKGFDINETSPTSLSFFNMQSRLQTINGSLKFYNEPNEGTRIELKIIRN